jgi:hypothetical protein
LVELAKIYRKRLMDFLKLYQSTICWLWKISWLDKSPLSSTSERHDTEHHFCAHNNDYSKSSNNLVLLLPFPALWRHKFVNLSTFSSYILVTSFTHWQSANWKERTEFWWLHMISLKFKRIKKMGSRLVNLLYTFEEYRNSSF